MSQHQILINRDEAELLTDLLMLTDSHLAASLDRELREAFGMGSLEQELAARGTDLGGVRKAWAGRIIWSRPLLRRL